MNSFYKSSTGSGDVALTVKGALIGLVPVLITLAQIYGVELAQDQVIETINLIAAVIAGNIALFGIGRKVYYFLAEKYGK